MKIKKALIIFCILMTLLSTVVISCYLYVNKSNNLNPEETIKKYMGYWENNFTLGLMSLEKKEFEGFDFIRNFEVSKIDDLIIEDVTDLELNEYVNQPGFEYKKEANEGKIKLYIVSFYATSNNEVWKGQNSLSLDLIYDEKRGWHVLAFGHP